MLGTQSLASRQELLLQSGAVRECLGEPWSSITNGLGTVSAQGKRHRGKQMNITVPVGQAPCWALNMRWDNTSKVPPSLPQTACWCQLETTSDSGPTVAGGACWLSPSPGYSCLLFFSPGVAGMH